MNSNKPIPPHVKEARKHLLQAEQRAIRMVDLLTFIFTIREEFELIHGDIEKAQDALEDSPPDCKIVHLPDQP